MEKQDNRIYDFFKKNILTEKSAIALLITMICILLIYIIGMRFIGFTEKTYLSDISVSTASKTEDSDADSTETAEISKININSDNIYELCKIPGIGEAKAQAIIEYRKYNGNFSDINELCNVRGIGDKIFENLKDYVYIGE